jgi:hypothetical protein
MPSKAVMQFPKNVSRRASGVILNSSRSVRSNKCVNFFGTLLRQGSREGVSVAERSVQDLRHVPRYHEPLQYVQDEEFSSMPESSECAEALGSSSPKKNVSFDEDVVVIPIPLRSDHTEILRSKLWSGAVEMCDNVGKPPRPENNMYALLSSRIELKPYLFVPPLKSATCTSLRLKTANGGMSASKMKCTLAASPKN